MDHILLSSTWAFAIEHHIAFPGMVAPPSPEFFWLLCHMLLDVYWPQREAWRGLQPSSYRAPLSSPSSTAFPGPASLQSCGLPAAAIQAFRGRAGTTTCHAGILHDELGLLELLA